VHRGRFGGNARKRKAKLTDATFHEMIGTAQAVELPVAILEPDQEAAVATIDAAVAVVVQFDRAQVPAPAAEARAFRAQDYQFGYVTCANCHNDQAYYLHRAILASGYVFRCRICRLEMTVMQEQ
jgi:hypothetical protein